MQHLPGTPSTRFLYWCRQPYCNTTAPGGAYTATASDGSSLSFEIDQSRRLSPVAINKSSFVGTPDRVTFTWEASGDSRSFYVHLEPSDQDASIFPYIAAVTLPASARSVTFSGLSLSTDTSYQAGVFAFSSDIASPAPIQAPFNMASDRVDFRPKIVRRLTVEKRGGGTVVDATGAIDCGDTCSAEFEQGEAVTLEATADVDSIFSGWSGGGCAGRDPICALTLDQDTVVTATFTKAPPGTPSGSATGTVLVGGVIYTSGPIPYGSRIDITNGTLTLRTRAGTLRVWSSGLSAEFLLLKRSERGRPLDLLKLVGGDFSVCPKSKRTISSVDAKKKPKKKPVRRLWAKGKGRFRTQGKYSYTTVRGTEWLTADRCDGTLTQVRQGRVEVVDLVRRTRTPLLAGQSYLSRAR